MFVLVIGVSMWSGVEVGKLHLDHTPRWPPRITPWTALKLHQLLGRYLAVAAQSQEVSAFSTKAELAPSTLLDHHG